MTSVGLVAGPKVRLRPREESGKAPRGAGVELVLLRGFELRCGDEIVPLPMSAQRLLAFLALHDQSLLRSYVAGTLWLEASDERANACLRSVLWRLQRSSHRLVEVTGRQLRLAQWVRVDVREIERLARSVIGGARGWEANGRAQELLADDLLPDWYDDWLAVDRECFRQLRLHALETVCERLTKAGKLGQALEAGLAAVAGDPLRESAHRALINVYLAEGNPGDALRQYRLYRRLLAEKLGLEPSAQIERLVGSLPRGVPGQPATER